jgi:hypothetical protein
MTLASAPTDSSFSGAVCMRLGLICKLASGSAIVSDALLFGIPPKPAVDAKEYAVLRLKLSRSPRCMTTSTSIEPRKA